MPLGSSGHALALLVVASLAAADAARAQAIAINDILAMPDVKARLDASGFTPNREPLDATTRRLDADLEKWRVMVGALGMKIR